MSFRGPVPKSADARLKGKPSQPTTHLLFERGEQPELPEEFDWPTQTRQWWRAWGEAAVAEKFTQLDWEYLLGTALLHAKLWERQSTEAAKELRLREEAFGVTIAARLRLRIQWIEAEEAEERRPAAPSARERFGARALASVSSLARDEASVESPAG